MGPWSLASAQMCNACALQDLTEPFISSASAAYAAIDVLCIGALRQPLTGAALRRMLVSLGASLAVGGGLAALLAMRGFSAWPQAIASVAGFIVIGAVAYRYRHGGAARGLGTRPWSTS